MACSKIAGFDLCPRVHGMNDRKLHMLRGTEVPESIADHVVEDVSLKSVREHSSALLRMVATFESGWTSASQLLGVHGSAARGEGVYLARNSLGKLLRTIYLCDYFTLSDVGLPARDLPGAQAWRVRARFATGDPHRHDPGATRTRSG
jgi:TnpA family transposase